MHAAIAEQGFAGADYGGYAELAGADRHVRIGTAELGDKPADITTENPVEAGVRAGHKENPSSEALWRIAD